MVSRGEFWSEDDIETLKELYKTNSARKVSKIMNRTEYSIKNAIARFNIKCGDSRRVDISERRYWSESDLELLKQFAHENKRVDEASIALDRSIASIYDMARRLNLNYGNPRAPLWSEEEDEILINNINLSIDKLAELIPNRSRHAIQGRRSILGIRFTTFKTPYKHALKGKSVNREHQIIMSNHIGRKLESGEHVHHIDCNGRNNNILNLYLTNNSDHKKLHIQLNRLLVSILPDLLEYGIVYFENGKYHHNTSYK